ncbi:MAG TPA: hypothetical protein ENJ09_08250, partial [Planctomycetes bacterium]|nr:hypothetical protein [Planctomycetota bacterium]
MLRNLFAVLLSLAALPAPSHAQVPKVGRDVYEDAVVYGFKMKVPKDWKQVPPQPDEENLLASFNDPDIPYISVGKSGEILPIACFLFAIDDRDADGNAIGGEQDSSSRILKLIQDRLSLGTAWDIKDDKPKPLKIKGVVRARSYVLEAQHTRDPEVMIEAYVADFELEPGLSIYFFGIGPGGRKWRSYESAYAKLAKSFRRVEIVGVEDLGSGRDTPRDRRRIKLQEEVARSPEWKLYETEHYLVVSDVKDKPFMDELLLRIEAIRKAYEEEYPPEEARAIRAKAEEEKRAAAAENGEDEEPAEEEDERSVSVQDPMLASLSSVLRVCSDRQTYSRYGGPPGTGGYWNPVDEELVIYDDKKSSGRDWTWIVLN